MTGGLANALVELRQDTVLEMVRVRVARGDDPLQVLEACQQGMTDVGDRYQDGTYFLAELMLSADIFREAVEILQPHLAVARPRQPLGRVLLATLRGDIHDLGKNILATLLAAHGFEVHDLGVDVDPALLLQRVREIEPDFVGFSALLTSSFSSMRQAADMLEEAGLRQHFKLMVGGGVTTPEVKKFVGADFQTLDAIEAVAYCATVSREETSCT